MGWRMRTTDRARQPLLFGRFRRWRASGAAVSTAEPAGWRPEDAAVGADGGGDLVAQPGHEAKSPRVVRVRRRVGRLDLLGVMPPHWPGRGNRRR